MFTRSYQNVRKILQVNKSSIKMINIVMFLRLSKGALNTTFGLNEAKLISHCFSLSRHLDFFEMVRNEDDSELAKRFDLVSSAPLVYFVVRLWYQRLCCFVCVAQFVRSQAEQLPEFKSV